MKIIINIIIKEFLQLKRDPRLFGIIFIAPILQLILFGYAANLDINNINTVVYDQDNTVTSRDFINKFQSSEYFSVNNYADSYEQVTDCIDKGKDLWALVIPKDFEKKLERSQQANVQAIFDGSDGNKAGIAAGYVSNLVSSYSQNILLEAKNKSGLKIALSGMITPELRVWYNPDLKTRYFMLPGIMGLILTIITTTLMAMAIVKEREIGTLEQIIVTPIKPKQLNNWKDNSICYCWIYGCTFSDGCDGLLVWNSNKRKLFFPNSSIFYLCAFCTWIRLIYINSIKNPAAGYDGCDVRNFIAYEFSFRFCFPY